MFEACRIKKNVVRIMPSIHDVTECIVGMTSELKDQRLSHTIKDHCQINPQEMLKCTTELKAHVTATDEHVKLQTLNALQRCVDSYQMFYTNL